LSTPRSNDVSLASCASILHPPSSIQPCPCEPVGCTWQSAPGIRTCRVAAIARVLGRALCSISVARRGRVSTVEVAQLCALHSTPRAQTIDQPPTRSHRDALPTRLCGADNLINEINSRGTFLITKACLIHMKAHGFGRVINMSPPSQCHSSAHCVPGLADRICPLSDLHFDRRANFFSFSFFL
jgi:hypothetical protein